MWGCPECFAEPAGLGRSATWRCPSLEGSECSAPRRQARACPARPLSGATSRQDHGAPGPLGHNCAVLSCSQRRMRKETHESEMRSERMSSDRICFARRNSVPNHGKAPPSRHPTATRSHPHCAHSRQRAPPCDRSGSTTGRLASPLEALCLNPESQRGFASNCVHSTTCALSYS